MKKYEDFDKTPDGEKYGYCARCDGAMSQYDVWHSQGHHHAKCFQIIQDEINFQIKWDRLVSMGMHILDNMEFDDVKPHKKHGLNFSAFQRKNGKWEEVEVK